MIIGFRRLRRPEEVVARRQGNPEVSQIIDNNRELYILVKGVKFIFKFIYSFSINHFLWQAIPFIYDSIWEKLLELWFISGMFIDFILMTSKSICILKFKDLFSRLTVIKPFSNLKDLQHVSSYLSVFNTW